MSLDIQPPVTDQGGKVFDIADPDLHGKILKAGPEVSEVRFDDGAQRYVTNVHLRVVDDGLSQLNPVQPERMDAAPPALATAADRLGRSAQQRRGQFLA